jgi:hypothetical protein
VFTGVQCDGDGGVPRFTFGKAERRTTCLYFYVWDAEFGSAFIKISAYFPYPVKVWVNGHEWGQASGHQGGDHADRRAGHWWELSMRQVEVCRTIVFTAPGDARGFFEALITDNLTSALRPH